MESNKEQLQNYKYDNYTITTNFPTYDDAVDFARNNGGNLIEIGFTDGHDAPMENNSGNLIANKRTFKIELPGESNYEILYSDSEGFQQWAEEVLEDQKKLDDDTAPEDWLSDQNIAPGDRIIILKDGKLNTVTTRERIKYLMRGNVYELAVKVDHTEKS